MDLQANRAILKSSTLKGRYSCCSLPEHRVSLRFKRLFMRFKRLFIFLLAAPSSVLLALMFFFLSLQSIKRKDDPEEVKVQIQFMVYGTRVSKDKSGAYLFLPDGKAKVCSSARRASVI